MEASPGAGLTTFDCGGGGRKKTASELAGSSLNTERLADGRGRRTDLAVAAGCGGMAMRRHKKYVDDSACYSGACLF